MLQLLISVLLSFGFSYDGGKVVGATEADTQHVIQSVKSDASYQILGGDEVFNSIAVVPDVDPGH